MNNYRELDCCDTCIHFEHDYEYPGRCLYPATYCVDRIPYSNEPDLPGRRTRKHDPAKAEAMRLAHAQWQTWLEDRPEVGRNGVCEHHCRRAGA